MYAEKTQGYEADPLYWNKQQYILLAESTSPLSEADEPTLKDLLNHVRVIMDGTISSIPKSKGSPSVERVEAKPDERTPERTDSLGDIMLYHASIFGDLISFEHEKSTPDKLTWKILESELVIPLKSKATLALVSFATMYAKLRLLDLVRDSDKLAKSIASLKQQKQQHKLGKNNNYGMEKWFKEVCAVIKTAANVADAAMALKEETSNRLPQLPTAVYKIVIVVVICWSQVVHILIKNNREGISLYTRHLENYQKKLNEKLDEIRQGKSTKDPTPHELIDEQPKTSSSLSEEAVRAKCCEKLRQLLSVKSQRHKITNTRTRSFP